MTWVAFEGVSGYYLVDVIIFGLVALFVATDALCQVQVFTAFSGNQERQVLCFYFNIRIEGFILVEYREHLFIKR